MAQLTVKIQGKLRAALDKLIFDVFAKLEKAKPITLRQAVEEALTQWLEKHEKQSTGGDLRPKGDGEKSLSVEIDGDLHKRVKLEARRRNMANLEPSKTRALVEAALIEWILAKGYDPGVTLKKPKEDKDAPKVDVKKGGKAAGKPKHDDGGGIE